MEKLFVQFPSSFLNEKKYIAHVVFSHFLGIDYEIEFVENSKYVKIATDQLFKKQVIILPDTLFQTAENKWLKKSSLPVLPLPHTDLSLYSKTAFYSTDLPLLYKGVPPEQLAENEFFFEGDIFGGIFYCITLYEELVLNTSDAYGRFNYVHSTSFKERLYHRAIANEYLEVLWYFIAKFFPSIKRKEYQYKVFVSHDVDHPLSSYSSSSIFVKACIGDVVSRKSVKVMFKRIASRFFTKTSLNYPDPNNTFKFIMDISEQHNLTSEFYFIVIKGNHTIDGNYEINSPFYKKLLTEINRRQHKIGFHPSFFTFCDYNKTQNEFSKLREICESINIQQDKWGGRQHYLRWKNPVTWEIWDKIGADFDSSIGWSTYTGFRAGICYEYPVYDLVKREMRNLVERPLIVMDVASAAYNSYRDFMNAIEEHTKICRFFNGNMVLLFHNNYLLSDRQKNYYKQIINNVTNHTYSNN